MTDQTVSPVNAVPVTDNKQKVADLLNKVAPYVKDVAVPVQQGFGFVLGALTAIDLWELL